MALRGRPPELGRPAPLLTFTPRHTAEAVDPALRGPLHQGILVLLSLVAAAALISTAWLCVPGWRVLWIAAIGVAWVAPGVVAMRRAYRQCASRWGLALLLGPPVGYALSSLCLLAVWLLGARSGWWLAICPAVASAIAACTPSLGTRLDVPRFGRRDFAAVALLLLIVPLIVARPYMQVGKDLPEGRAYRAYFTADVVWAMAVVSEVSKGDVLPRNPYHLEMPLHYYWLAHLLPALEHRTLGREVRLDHLLLANAVFSGAMFIGFLYGLGKQVARTVAGASVGCVVTVLFTSPEGLYALLDLWGQDRPLSLVRYLNIDAVSRWFVGALPIDGLHRLLLYQPQHQIGYALACTALLIMAQQAPRPRARAAAAAGVLLGFGFLISTFSALMVAVMVAGLGGVAIVMTRQWSVGVRQAMAGAVPLLAALWLSRHLEYVTGGGQLIDVMPNPLAVRHPIAGPLLSMGPLLATIAVGAWLWNRKSIGRDRALLPGIALVVCVAFYFFVDVRDHQDVYVGWRAGHLIFITAGGFVGWTWWQLLHRDARAWHAAGCAALLLAVLATAPTSAIDLFNSQDITNRAQAAGFPWTLMLGHDELNALRWIATNTPIDARVQVDPVARDPGTWAYIPAFGERRMSAGLPISMIPLAPYQLASERVRRLYAASDAAVVLRIAQSMRIDVLVVGAEENRAHPQFGRLLDRYPVAFPPLYRTRNITLYAASARMRALTRQPGER